MKEKNLDDNKYIKMSTQAVVNTNMSSVSDPNAIRGNYPNGVYAYDMGPGVGDTTVPFDLSSIVGSEKFHAFAGLLPVQNGGANGSSQVITITLAGNHGWTSLTHEIEVSLEQGSNDGTDSEPAADLSAGTASASFGSGTAISILRQGGRRDGSDCDLSQATMLVTIVKRPVDVV